MSNGGSTDGSTAESTAEYMAENTSNIEPVSPVMQMTGPMASATTTAADRVAVSAKAADKPFDAAKPLVPATATTTVTTTVTAMIDKGIVSPKVKTKPNNMPEPAKPPATKAKPRNSQKPKHKTGSKTKAKPRRSERAAMMKKKAAELAAITKKKADEKLRIEWERAQAAAAEAKKRQEEKEAEQRKRGLGFIRTWLKSRAKVNVSNKTIKDQAYRRGLIENLSTRMTNTQHAYVGNQLLDPETRHLQDELGILAAATPDDPPVLVSEDPIVYRPPGHRWKAKSMCLFLMLDSLLTFLELYGVGAPRAYWIFETFLATVGLDSSNSTLEQRLVCLYIVLVLSKNTKDRDAIASAQKLFERTRMDPRAIADLPPLELQAIIGSSGYGPQNQRYIHALCQYMIQNGKFPDDTLELEEIYGCGQKITHCFGLDVFQTRNSFGVDVHVLRIALILQFWMPPHMPEDQHKTDADWLKEQTKFLVASLKTWVPMQKWPRVNIVFGSIAQLLTQSGCQQNSKVGTVADMRKLVYYTARNHLSETDIPVCIKILECITKHYDAKNKD